MKKHLLIDPHSLPEEGKSYSGELDSNIFTLSREKVHATGPLLYDLHLQKFETELLVRGTLSVPIEFTCVRTLTPFVKTIYTDDFSTCIEITSTRMDLTDTLREELILLFPDYPRCDDGDVPMECNLDSRYLAVDKPPDDDVKTPPRDAAPNPWDALDALQDDSPESQPPA